MKFDRLQSCSPPKRATNFWHQVGAILNWWWKIAPGNCFYFILSIAFHPNRSESRSFLSFLIFFNTHISYILPMLVFQSGLSWCKDFQPMPVSMPDCMKWNCMKSFHFKSLFPTIRSKFFCFFSYQWPWLRHQLSGR